MYVQVYRMLYKFICYLLLHYTIIIIKTTTIFFFHTSLILFYCFMTLKASATFKTAFLPVQCLYEHVYLRV